MRVIWANPAKRQLRQILSTIRDARGSETSSRWFWKIRDAVVTIADFPLIGTPLPENTHNGFNGYFANLRQIVIPPYRIVYEPRKDVCEVLFCQRTSQLLSPHHR